MCTNQHTHTQTRIYQQTNKQTILTPKYILKNRRLEAIKLLQETDEEKSVTLVVEIVYGIQKKYHMK